MKIVDNIAHKLYLGVSKIPGAGIGLFTGVDISSGKPICEYKGEIFDLEDVTEKDREEFNKLDFKGRTDGPKTIKHKLDDKALKRLGEKYAYTMTLGFDEPTALYAISWQKQSAAGRITSPRKIIDCQPSLTDEEMGLGGFVNDKQGYLERVGEKYEKELEARNKELKTLDDLKTINELDLSLGYNCSYWSHPTEILIYLLSIRDIKAGEEIYVNYTHEYWLPFLKKVEKDKTEAEKKAEEAQEQPEKTESDSPPKATMVDIPEDLISTASENIKDE